MSDYPVGLYKFNNNLNDDSGNGRNGIGYGTIAYSNTNKIVGTHALYLATPDTDYVSLPYSFLDGTGTKKWTMAFWYRSPDLPANYWREVFSTLGGEITLVQYWADASNITLKLRDGSGVYRNFSFNIPENTWKWIVIDWDGFNYHFYIDNVSAGSSASTPSNVTGGTAVRLNKGSVYTGNAPRFDVIFFFDRVLTSIDRNQLWNGGAGIETYTPPSPVANFSADITSGNIPLTVNFTDISEGIPTYWEWDFGDGSAKSYLQNPTHIYNVAGTYTVNLTVSNAWGYDTETKVDYITGINIGNADFSLSLPQPFGEAWGIDLTLPNFQVAGGGYWTEYTKMILPILKVSGFGERISIDGIINLPTLQVLGTGYAGGIGQAQLILPIITITGTDPITGISQLRLPLLQIYGTGFGGEVGTGKIILPLIKTSGFAPVTNIGNVDIILPNLEILGTGLRGNVAQANIILPILTISSSGIGYISGTGSAILTLPLLKISSVGYVILSEAFSTFVVNTKNAAISKYTNYNYNSFCKFENLYLGANSEGIYLLEGLTDNGIAINSKISTGLLSMGVDKLKRIISFFLGMKSYGSYDLKLITDDGIEHTYAFTNNDSILHPLRTKTGRGKKGKYWLIKFLNKDGSDFEIDSINAEMEVTSRQT